MFNNIIRYFILGRLTTDEIFFKLFAARNLQFSI